MSSHPSSRRIIGLYAEHAAAWDEARGTILRERQWIDAFLDQVRPGGEILDLGCGSGEPVARHLVGRGFRVTGLDASPGLLALCKERFPDQNWHLGDMRALDLGRRFDGVLAWYSFFHLDQDDQRSMFARFADHAAPGAPLCFTSGPADGEAIGEWQNEPLYHASLAPAEYCALLAANGFDVLSFRAGEPLADGPSVWLARSAATLRPQGRSLPDDSTHVEGTAHVDR
jgi:SAM-dependent methyltransferase